MMDIVRVQPAEPLIQIQINTDITGRYSTTASDIHPVVCKEFLIISIIIANFEKR